MSETTASEKTLGLYALLLLSTREWSLSQLACHFGCSKSTILRLLRHVERLEGVALKAVTRTTDGRPQKWYSLERPLTAPERQHTVLKADEMRLLTLCRDLAMPFLPARLSKTLDSSLRRASVLLSGQEECREHIAPFVQPASLGMIDYTPLQGMLHTLLRAIEQRIVCEVTYAPSGKPERVYEMAVTRLVSGRHALYVHGWKVVEKGCAKAQHPLFFAVHRIRAVQLTRRTHELTTPEEDAGFGLMDGTPFRVCVRITKEAATYVRERVFGPEQNIEDMEDGSVVLSFIARSEDELLAWVLSFGRRAYVLKPIEFAEKVRIEARAIARQV